MVEKSGASCIFPRLKDFLKVHVHVIMLLTVRICVQSVLGEVTIICRVYTTNETLIQSCTPYSNV